jgi:hypothetical protein
MRAGAISWLQFIHAELRALAYAQRKRREPRGIRAFRE